MINFDLIPRSHASKVIELVDKVMRTLKNKDLFIPSDTSDIDKLFAAYDLMGAYDDKNNLVGIGEFIHDVERLRDYMKILGIEHDSVGEIGCLIDPNAREQGIGYKLCEVTLLHGKRERKVKDIIATAHPNNIASRRIMKKLNFVEHPSQITSKSGLPRILGKASVN